MQGNILLSQSHFLKHGKTNNNNLLKTYKIINLNCNYKDFHAKWLKNEKNQILENIWQSCKVYKETFSCLYKNFDTILWKHGKEIHITNDNKLTNDYFIWKDKLMNNKYPIEYPMGISNQNNYNFIIDDKYNLYSRSIGYQEAFKNSILICI